MPTVVVYSVAQSRVRRIIVLDETDSVENHSLLEGEAALVLDSVQVKDGVPDVDALNALVSDYTGKPTQSDRYHLVNAAGEVVNTLCLDPAIDKLPLDVGVSLRLAE